MLASTVIKSQNVELFFDIFCHFNGPFGPLLTMSIRRLNSVLVSFT